MQCRAYLRFITRQEQRSVCDILRPAKSIPRVGACELVLSFLSGGEAGDHWTLDVAGTKSVDVDAILCVVQCCIGSAFDEEEHMKVDHEPICFVMPTTANLLGTYAGADAVAIVLDVLCQQAIIHRLSTTNHR